VVAVAVRAYLSLVRLPAPGEGFGALSERERSRWALAGCLLLAVLLRAPYLSTPLGVDEGGVAYIARDWLSGPTLSVLF
jgi:hypothetical protein